MMFDTFAIIAIVSRINSDVIRSAVLAAAAIVDV
jgi:hypothetical protein